MRPIDADAIPYTMLYKENWLKGTGVEKRGVWKDTIDAMPTIEPEITLEIAIDYLHKIGWMQEHDRILTESAQPEKCEDCGNFNKTMLVIPQPERKVGRWIIVTDSRGQHAECPYCGEWKYHQNQKFCGECGSYNGAKTEAKE